MRYYRAYKQMISTNAGLCVAMRSYARLVCGSVCRGIPKMLLGVFFVICDIAPFIDAADDDDDD